MAAMSFGNRTPFLPSNPFNTFVVVMKRSDDIQLHVSGNGQI